MLILNIITLIYIIWSVYTIIDLLQAIKEMKYHQDTETDQAYRRGYNEAIERINRRIKK